MRSTLGQLISLLLVALALSPARARGEDCARTYGRIAGAKARAKLIRGKALVKMDSAAFNVFEKIRLNPETELSAGELALIKAGKLEATLEAYRGTSGAVRKLNQMIALRKRAQPIKRAHKAWPGFKKWTADTFRYLGYSANGMLPQDTMKVERLLLDYLGQAVLPASRFGGPTQYAAHIYARALRADFYGLSEFDRNFLKTWGFEKDYERFVTDARQYREGLLAATKIQDAADGLKWGVLGTATAAAAVAPYLAERVEKPEELAARVKAIRGGVQLMFSDDPAVPTLLRTEGSAVLFEVPEAKFLRGEKLAEFDRTLAEKKISYSRVVIQASPAEVHRVMAKAKEFVTRTKKDGQGRKVLDRRMHLDSGLAESYKILQSELGFPPAPVAKRYANVMSAYFGVMKLAGGREGRVKDFFVSRVAPGSESQWREATEQALSSYFDAMIYAFSPKLMGGAALTLDALPNTLWKKELPIGKKPGAPRPRGPAPVSVPVSQ